MRKEFVTYEIARILNELGFNEECLWYWSQVSLNPEKWELNEYIVDDCYDYIDAPLWQQAQTWFLKNHNLDVRAAVVWDNVSIGDSRIFMFIPHVNVDYYDEGSNTSYEARKDAILKAIELCKEKSN